MKGKRGQTDRNLMRIYADILLTVQLPHTAAISAFCILGFTTIKKDF